MESPCAAGASEAEDDEDDLVWKDDSRRLGTVGYSVMLFLAAGGIAAINIFLLSSMGIGVQVLQWLIEDGYDLQIYPSGVSFMIFLLLYVFDFFWPPHLPGLRCRLWKKDKCFGRSVCGVAGVLFIISCILMAKDYPSVPMVMGIVFEPVFVAAFRVFTKPHAFEVNADQAVAADVHRKMKMLKKICGDEEDTMHFFKACVVAFGSVFLITTTVWIAMAIGDGGPSSDDKTAVGSNVAFLVWVTPLVVGIGNFIFGLFVLLRIAMQRNYASTDTLKNTLIADTSRSSLVCELAEHRLTVRKVRQSQTGMTPTSTASANEKRRQKYLEQGQQHVKQLTMIFKILGMVSVFILGAAYLSLQLTSLDSSISSMILGILGSFFVLFVVFLYFMFRRVVEAMGQWLQDLPAWKFMKKMKSNDWVRALFVCMFLPMFPFVLCIAVANQCVRKCRGIYKNEAARERSQYSESVSSRQLALDPEALWVTPRLHLAMHEAMSWPIIPITTKITVLCLLFFGFYVSPYFINIGFSWLREELKDFYFWQIIVITFWVGVAAFLLPPVPGLTVYVFGGLMISGNCPEEYGGFWGGSVINIFLSWFLKLTACAVQQKGIGELLGKTQYVRSLIGVHTVATRTIEKLLRKPGWSVGKVALLCGGPDWPVSVTAGILKLSLYQCELGTIPIIIFVVPCALTGSFYLKMGKAPVNTGGQLTAEEQAIAEEQEMWNKAGQMMAVVTLGVTAILWAIMTWALQQTLEHNYDELNLNLPQNVDLHWIDHKHEQLKTRCSMSWDGVPCCMRLVLLLSTLAHIMCCQAIYWGKKYLFGTFAVQSPFETLVFYGEPPEAVFGILAVIMFAVYVVGWGGLIIFEVWKSQATKACRLEVLQELNNVESKWKEEWLQKAIAAKEAYESKDPQSQEDTVGEQDGGDAHLVHGIDRGGSGEDVVVSAEDVDVSSLPVTPPGDAAEEPVQEHASETVCVTDDHPLAAAAQSETSNDQSSTTHVEPGSSSTVTKPLKLPNSFEPLFFQESLPETSELEYASSQKKRPSSPFSGFQWCLSSQACHPCIRRSSTGAAELDEDQSQEKMVAE